MADALLVELAKRVLAEAGLTDALVIGLEATLAELDLTDTDAATVAIVRGMAVAVTLDPCNAALWREYRAALGALTEQDADDTDDGIESFRFELRLPPPPAAKPRKPRASRTKVGDTPDA